MINEAHKRFLLCDAHAGKTRHSGRTLYRHLAGTHDLLQEWCCPKDVCTAGLFHSIYGTHRFRHRSWPLDRRETIIELIGAPAEQLVYIFCVVDRPRAFVKRVEVDGVTLLHDTHTDCNLVVPPKTMRHLLEIEAANLLEQGSRSPLLDQLLVDDMSATVRKAIKLRGALR